LLAGNRGLSISQRRGSGLGGAVRRRLFAGEDIPDQPLATLGHEVSAAGVAILYRSLVDGIVIDQTDAELAPRIEASGTRTLVTNAVMGGAEDRRRLALEVIEFGRSLATVEVPA